MRRRRAAKVRVGVERLEAKQRLSASNSATALTNPGSSSGDAAYDLAGMAGASAAVTASTDSTSAARAGHRKLPIPPTAFLVHRITNPTKHAVNLIPSFQQVLVQAKQPVPGQVYNVLYIAVKNGTAQTFTATRNFSVTFPGVPHPFPILTGNQQWRPGQWIVFYVLTKKYYPLRSQLSGGFELLLPGRLSTLIPGQSAIFLRLRYNADTFARTLNWIVAFGQGAQLGFGPLTGMADTAINNTVAGRSHKIDFGGHF
jgi:hypothetical protein